MTTALSVDLRKRVVGVLRKRVVGVVAAGASRHQAVARFGVSAASASRWCGHPVTNVRNTASPHWRPWLKPEYRCLVPATAFSEYADTKLRKTPVWFALDADRPLFAFAGIWRPWKGARGAKRENLDRVSADHRLFSLLTCPANGVVGPVHPKAMPVLLTKPENWARGSRCRPPKRWRCNGRCRTTRCEVARGARQDGAD